MKLHGKIFIMVLKAAKVSKQLSLGLFSRNKQVTHMYMHDGTLEKLFDIWGKKLNCVLAES